MSRAWAEIDLGAVRSNVRALRRLSGRDLIAVVKANAYGHGAVSAGKAALEAAGEDVHVVLEIQFAVVDDRHDGHDLRE